MFTNFVLNQINILEKLIIYIKILIHFFILLIHFIFLNLCEIEIKKKIVLIYILGDQYRVKKKYHNFKTLYF